MKLREALIAQSPSLALQRAAADEVARQDALIAELLEALKALVALRDEVDPEGLFDGLESIRAKAVIAKAEAA